MADLAFGPLATSEGIAAQVERLTTEGLIGMRSASRLYGQCREGIPTHPATVTRHATLGVKLPSGDVLKLESVRVAGKIMTSRAAVLRFFTAMSETPTPETASIPRSPAAHTRASTAAGAKLDAMGVR